MFNQFKRLFLIFGTVVTAALFTGCSAQFWDEGAPPYSVTAPVYRLAGPDDICTGGGVFFDFYNKSEKEVVFIKVCMNIYDSGTGALAFAGASELTCGSSCHLQKSQKSNFCVSLDEYSLPGPDESLFIDNFFISRIEYSDGSCWNDRLGVYADLYRKEA